MKASFKAYGMSWEIVLNEDGYDFDSIECNGHELDIQEIERVYVLSGPEQDEKYIALSDALFDRASDAAEPFEKDREDSRTAGL